MKIGKIFAVCAVVIGLVFSSIPQAYADETSDIILKLLIKKGLISQNEIDEMKAEIKKTQAASPAAAGGSAEKSTEKAAVKPVKKDEALNAYWKEGLNFRTEDKKFDLKVGGRVFTDVMMLQQDSAMNGRFGEEANNGEIRDARINMSGSVFENYIYRFEIDFAGNSAPNIKDMYMGLKNIPYIGTFRAGHYKQPISLEEIESAANLTFMEKSLSNVFIPAYRLGFQINNTAFDDRLTWAASLFNESNNDISTSNEWSFASRVTGLPWYEDNGAKLLHLGVGYTLRNPEQNLQYQQRPEAHMAPYYANTGSFAASNASTVVYEAAGVYGPVFLQGELIQDFVNKTNSSGYVYFQGCYGQISYFLTGEHREYDKNRGIFSILRPKNNFSISERKFGAWEIAARYSYLDLKDDGINGGELNDATLGLNWYLNPNMRIMENYIHSHRNGTGDADILMTRFQVDY